MSSYSSLGCYLQNFYFLILKMLNLFEGFWVCCIEEDFYVLKRCFSLKVWNSMTSHSVVPILRLRLLCCSSLETFIRLCNFAWSDFCIYGKALWQCLSKALLVWIPLKESVLPRGPHLQMELRAWSWNCQPCACSSHNSKGILGMIKD